MRSNHLLRLALSCLLLAALTSTAQAAAVREKGVQAVDSPDDIVPSPDAQMLSAGPIEYPSAAIKEKGVQIAVSGGTPPTDLGGGNWAVDSFFDITYRIDFDSAGGPVTVTGSGAGHVGGTGSLFDLDDDGDIDIDDGGARLFDTEMLSLDLDGGPFFKIRESPTLQSIGQSLIENQPGGGYRIASFFDVFTELSIDGGQTWQPASAAWGIQSIPEPSTLILAALATAGAAALARRKRR